MERRKIWIGFLLFFTCLCGGLVAILAEPYPLVKGDGYNGVIFPKTYLLAPKVFANQHAETFWTPTEAAVAKAEKTIAVILRKAQGNPALIDPFSAKSEQRAEYLKREIPKIVAELPNYRRQYFGLIVGGKKKFTATFFPVLQEPKKATSLTGGKIF